MPKDLDEEELRCLRGSVRMELEIMADCDGDSIDGAVVNLAAQLKLMPNDIHDFLEGNPVVGTVIDKLNEHIGD